MRLEDVVVGQREKASARCAVRSPAGRVGGGRFLRENSDQNGLFQDHRRRDRFCPPCAGQLAISRAS
jgi:hypothetical protein